MFSRFFSSPFSYHFSEQLRLYGPEGSVPSCSEAEAKTYCRNVTRSHYENFSVAGLLLPKELRVPFETVYAYCRWSDDLADENDGSEESRQKSLELLDWWNQKLDECFQADGPQPQHPVFVALKPIAKKFRLPKQPFSDLLLAFRRDQIQRNYETLDDLLDYCRCSANPVGRIVLYLVYGLESATDCKNPMPNEQQREQVRNRCGVKSVANAATNESGELRTDFEFALECSDSICTGLQLANFWQDIARDREMGRCYIPKEYFERYRLDAKNFEDSEPFRKMLAELVADARQRLLDGTPLVASVPKKVRIDIELFLQGGLAILDAIEKNGYNVLLERPVVSRWKKLRLLWNAWLKTPKEPGTKRSVVSG